MTQAEFDTCEADRRFALMFIAAMPLALGGVSIGLLAVGILVLATLAYTLLTRDNPRQVEEDAEREEVLEQIGLHEHIDFESDLHPPREP